MEGEPLHESRAKWPGIHHRPRAPTRVLLTMQEYQHLTGGQMTLIEALAQPDADFDFDPPRAQGLYKSADMY
jgi:hypothetical protein